MTLFDELRIAWVHLRERKRQSLLTALGVAVSSAMLITTIAVARGSTQSVIDRIIEIAPHIIVSAERVEPIVPDNLIGTGVRRVSMVERHVVDAQKETIKDYPGVAARIKGLDGIEVVSPSVSSRLIIRNRSRFASCTAIGIHPEQEARIAGLEEKLMERNALLELGYTPSGILLGDQLAEKLDADYHSRLLLITPSGDEYSVLVVGRYDSGFTAKDERDAYINLPLGQRIEGLASNAVTEIGLKTNDVATASAVAGEVQSVSGYLAESWDETNKNIIDFYNRNGLITLVLVGFVFVVAGLGVSSVMTTVVLQKTKDIAIMRSIGVQQQSITRIFMMEGFMIGVFGAAFGSPLGHLICHLVSLIRYEANTAGTFQSDRIVLVETPESHLLVVTFGILIAVISSFGPARRAAGFMPVKVLRGQAGG
ncbi:MAG: FtsX-like permease family protein [Prosthecochloris sp.]|nr:FtsX-like permease family protein [Prosthecochloris sp.]